MAIHYVKRINFEPIFERDTLPCDAELGDLIVMTPLARDEVDTTDQGLASYWLCIRERRDKEPVVWARIQFDGIATCGVGPVQTPPQNRPVLYAG